MSETFTASKKERKKEIVKGNKTRKKEIILNEAKMNKRKKEKWQKKRKP